MWVFVFIVFFLFCFLFTVSESAHGLNWLNGFVERTLIFSEDVYPEIRRRLSTQGKYTSAGVSYPGFWNGMGGRGKLYEWYIRINVFEKLLVRGRGSNKKFADRLSREMPTTYYVRPRYWTKNILMNFLFSFFYRSLIIFSYYRA